MAQLVEKRNVKTSTPLPVILHEILEETTNSANGMALIASLRLNAVSIRVRRLVHIIRLVVLVAFMLRAPAGWKRVPTIQAKAHVIITVSVFGGLMVNALTSLLALRRPVLQSVITPQLAAANVIIAAHAKLHQDVLIVLQVHVVILILAATGKF